MAQKISIMIGLDGGDQVERELKQIGQTGEESFKQIESSANQVDFSQITDSTTELQQGFKALAEVINQYAGSFQAASQNTAQLAIAQEHLTIEAVKVGTEVAKTTAEIGKMAFEVYEAHLLLETFTGHADKAAGSVLKLGAEVATITRALPLIGIAINPITLSIAAIVGTLAGLGLVIEGVARGAAAFAEEWRKLSEDTKTLSEDTGTSFDQLQRGRSVFEELGISGEKFAEAVRKINEAIKDLDVEDALKKSSQAIDDQVTKILQARRDLLQAQIERGVPTLGAAVSTLQEIAALNQEIEQRTNKVTDAQKKYNDEIEKQKELQANNLAVVLEVVQAIESGSKIVEDGVLKGLSFDPLVKGKTIIDAFNLSLKQAADQGRDVSQVFLDFVVNAQRAQAIQVGKAFGFSTEDIDKLRAGLLRLDEIRQRLGFSAPISPGAKRLFDELTESTLRLNSAWDRLNKAWESSVFSQIAAIIARDLKNLETSFIDFASTALETFNRFIDSIPARWDLGIARMKEAWNDFVAFVLDGAAKLVGALPEFLGGSQEKAAQLIETANSFRQAGLEAAQAAADAMNRIRGIGDESAKSLKKGSDAADDQKKKVDDLAGGWKLATDAQIRAQNQIEESSRRAADQIANLQRQISNLLTRTREEGIQKGIIDPMTFGPVAGQEEAFEALMNRQARARKELERQQQEIAQRQQEQADQLRQELQGAIGAVSFQPLVQKGQQATDQIKQSFGEGLKSAVAGIDFSSVFQPLIDAARKAIDQINQLFSNLGQSIINAIDFSGLISKIDEVTSAFRRMADAANAAAAAAAGGGAGGGGGGNIPTEFASGGLLHGRPGIDTNLARFTAGEFVIRREAVLKWGVDFLQAINAGINPFRVPAFAKGGLVSSSQSNVTINFPGLPPISGLRASSDTVEELRRAAAMAQVRSGGRKPSRYS